MTRTLGCLAHLTAIALLTIAVDRTYADQVAAQLRPWAGLVASVLLVLGASNFLHLFGGYGRGDASRRTLLARARTGEPPAGDGPMLVHGTAHTSDRPLRAPLSGIECVCYEYRIFERRWNHANDQHRVVVYWWGAGVVPFSVQTEGRAIRVSAMPELVFDADTERDDEQEARAQDYVATTAFEDVAGLELAGVGAAMLSDALASHPSGLRRDWRRAGVDGPDWSRLRFEERAVPVGATVSAAGHWSADRRALVPEPGGLGSSRVSLTLGDPTPLLRTNTAIPNSATSVAVFGVLLLALGAAAVWAIQAGWLAAGAF